jgi:hypothetical protein
MNLIIYLLPNHVGEETGLEPIVATLDLSLSSPLTSFLLLSVTN